MSKFKLRLVRWVCCAALVFQAGCLTVHRPKISAADFALFATLDQSTTVGRTSCAVGVAALVALQRHRESGQWPSSMDEVTAHVRTLGPEGWLLSALGEFSFVPAASDEVAIVTKDGGKPVAQVNRDGSMDIPAGSPLRSSAGGSGGGTTGDLTGTIVGEFIGQLLRAL